MLSEYRIRYDLLCRVSSSQAIYVAVINYQWYNVTITQQNKETTKKT